MFEGFEFPLILPTGLIFATIDCSACNWSLITPVIVSLCIVRKERSRNILDTRFFDRSDVCPRIFQFIDLPRLHLVSFFLSLRLSFIVPRSTRAGMFSLPVVAYFALASLREKLYRSRFYPSFREPYLRRHSSAPSLSTCFQRENPPCRGLIPAYAANVYSARDDARVIFLRVRKLENFAARNLAERAEVLHFRSLCTPA